MISRIFSGKTARIIAAMVGAILLLPASSGAAEPYLETPIRYWDRSPRDFTRDWERSDAAARLDSSTETAFLDSVLQELEISPSSQVLVFSTTSFQVDLITPDLPRALFFNENHYVGWVPGGDLEVATVGPKTGMNFYQVPVPARNEPLEFIRNQACLSCHGSNADTPFPRTLLFSVFANEEGAQVLRGKTHHVDHRTPIEKRWGGGGMSREPLPGQGIAGTCFLLTIPIYPRNLILRPETATWGRTGQVSQTSWIFRAIPPRPVMSLLC